MPSHLMLTCSPLDGRVAPRRAPLASPLRRSRRRERPHGCRRCRRCRRAARLCAYDGRCRRQGTCESRTGDSDSRPTPLPVSAAVADAGREQRAGRRARRVGGMPTSAAGGARAQMPWRMVRDASPSSRTDNPVHAWAVRGAEVTGSQHHDKAKQDRVRGTARAHGTACLEKQWTGRPIILDEKVAKRTAKKESKGDRQPAFLDLRQVGLGRAGNGICGICVRRALVGASQIVIRAWCGIDDGSGAYGCARKIREHTLGGGGLPVCTFPGQLAGEGDLVEKRTWSSGRGGGPMASGHRPERAARGVQPMGSSSGVWRLCVVAQERHVTRKTGFS